MLILLLVLAGASCQNAHAALSSYAQVIYSGPYGITPLRDEDERPAGLSSSEITGQYKLVEPGHSSLFYGEARSSAAYGSLTAYSWVWVSQDGAVLATDHLAYASASFSDTLTFTRNGGGTGFARFVFTISGNTSREFFRADAQAMLTVRHGPEWDNPGGQILVGQTARTRYLPLTFGKPLEFGASFDAWVTIVSDSVPYTGYGWCNFASGVRLVGVEVFDSSLHPIAGYTIKALSGTIYPVPEPQAAMVLSAALAALAASVARGRRPAAGSGQFARRR